MHVRQFSSDLKTKVPGGHPGLYAVPILIEQRPISSLEGDEYAVNAPPFNELSAASRGSGVANSFYNLSLMLNLPATVVALYFDPHASLEEHRADHPILFMVIAGQGTVRIGGPQGEQRTLTSGEAVLWLTGIDHMAWTDDEAMQAITIEFPG